MRILLLLFPILLGFRSIPESYRGITKEELAKQIDQVKLSQFASKKKLFNATKKKRRKKIEPFSPTFDNEQVSIATFERFRAVIDGNIISSGPQVNFKVDILDFDKIPRGSYLSCTGSNLSTKSNYRIIASCDRLITPKAEYEVIVGIKDLAKVDGLKPDHVYVGDEEAILGEGFSAIMGGIIGARKERVKTSIGFAETPTIKNAYLSGLVSAARLANQKAKEHTSDQVTVLAVKDQTEVIVEFKRRFNYESEI